MKEQPSEPSGEDNKDQTAPSIEETKVRKELNVVSVPNDRDMIAEEMAELFEEDQVTHQHGSSEPEGD